MIPLRTPMAQDMAREEALVPVIATGRVFATYMQAARRNLETMLRLSETLRDAEFAREAQLLLDNFNDCARGAEDLIADSAANEAVFRDCDQFWRDSIHAENAGLGEVA